MAKVDSDDTPSIGEIGTKLYELKKTTFGGYDTKTTLALLSHIDADHQKKCEILRDQIKLLTDKNEKIFALDSAKNERIAALESVLADSKTEITGYLVKVEDLSGVIAELKEFNEQQFKDIADKANTIERLRLEVGDTSSVEALIQSKDELERVKAELLLEKLECSRLEATIQELQKTLAIDKSETSDHEALLTIDITSAQQHMEELADMSAANVQLTEINRQLEQKIEDLKDSISEPSDSAIGRAFIEAQRSAKATINDAKAQASDIILHAQLQGTRILDKYTTLLNQLKSLAGDATKKADDLQSNLSAFAEATNSDLREFSNEVTKFAEESIEEENMVASDLDPECIPGTSANESSIELAAVTLTTTGKA